MKQLPSFKDVYRSIRKPMAPPTKTQRDEREDMRRRDDRRQMEKYKGARGRGRSDSDDT
jgi:hypothetical protein